MRQPAGCDPGHSGRGPTWQLRRLVQDHPGAPSTHWSEPLPFGLLSCCLVVAGNRSPWPGAHNHIQRGLHRPRGLRARGAHDPARVQGSGTRGGPFKPWQPRGPYAGDCLRLQKRVRRKDKRAHLAADLRIVSVATARCGSGRGWVCSAWGPLEPGAETIKPSST